MAFEFTSLAGCFQLLIASGKDGGVAAGEAVGRGDIAQGAVQARGIIMVDELADDALGVVDGERGFGADGLLFEGAVKAFEFAVALRVMG